MFVIRNNYTTKQSHLIVLKVLKFYSLVIALSLYLLKQTRCSEGNNLLVFKREQNRPKFFQIFSDLPIRHEFAL